MISDEMKRRLAELRLTSAEVGGRFDAKCEVLRVALEDLVHPMRVNAIAEVCKELLSDEEWLYLEWTAARRGR